MGKKGFYYPIVECVMTVHGIFMLMLLNNIYKAQFNVGNMFSRCVQMEKELMSPGWMQDDE